MAVNTALLLETMMNIILSYMNVTESANNLLTDYRNRLVNLQYEDIVLESEMILYLEQLSNLKKKCGEQLDLLT